MNGAIQMMRRHSWLVNNAILAGVMLKKIEKT